MTTGRQGDALRVVCGRGRNPTVSISRCPTVGSRPAVFPGQVDVLPAERRDVGQEVRPGFLENAARCGRGGEADDGPGGHERGARPDDEGEDVAAPGAQGHADGNLSPPLRYGVAEQAVEAERGQQERERREAADEDGDEAGLGHRGRQPGVHGHHRRDRCAGARLGHRLAEERDRRERVARRIPWEQAGRPRPGARLRGRWRLALGVPVAETRAALSAALEG